MKQRFILGSFLALILILATGVYWWVSHNRLDRVASEVMRVCAPETYINACYDRVLPLLIDRGYTMEETFAIASRIAGMTIESGEPYFYCHVAGHGIASKETAKDPSRWTEVIARCPPGICANGCMHGAAQERFRAESLTDEEIEAFLPELRSICTEKPAFTKIEVTACHHALGHLSLYLNHGVVEKALATCDAISFPDDALRLRTCYEGVFMQVYQPMEPEDYALVRDVAPTDIDTIAPFCAPFEDAQLSACRTESWPLYGRDALKDPEALEAFCALNPGTRWQERCLNDLFFIFSAMHSFDPERLIPFCDTFMGATKAQCFANAAAASIEGDYRLETNALALCRAAQERGLGERCYDELLFYSDYSFLPDSEEFKRFCSALPEPVRDACLAGAGARMAPRILQP